MLKPTEVWDQYYLDVRCMLIETGATLDRYDASLAREKGNGQGTVGDDPRTALIREAIAILAEDSPLEGEATRAERLLLLFSDPKE